MISQSGRTSLVGLEPPPRVSCLLSQQPCQFSLPTTPSLKPRVLTWPAVADWQRAEPEGGEQDNQDATTPPKVMPPALGSGGSGRRLPVFSSGCWLALPPRDQGVRRAFQGRDRVRISCGIGLRLAGRKPPPRSNNFECPLVLQSTCLPPSSELDKPARAPIGGGRPPVGGEAPLGLFSFVQMHGCRGDIPTTIGWKPVGGPDVGASGRPDQGWENSSTSLTWESSA